MPGSFDPVEDGTGNILRQQPRSIPANVVVLAKHHERGDLDRLQGAMHAEKRFPLAQHLREGMSQSDERRAADQTAHVPAVTRAAIGI